MKTLRTAARASCAGVFLASLVIAGCVAETTHDEGEASADALIVPPKLPPRFFCFDTLQDMTPAGLSLRLDPPPAACSSVSTVEVDKVLVPSGKTGMWIRLRAETEAVVGAGLRYRVDVQHHQLVWQPPAAPRVVEWWEEGEWKIGELDEIPVGQPGSDRLWYTGGAELHWSAFDAIVAVRAHVEAWDGPPGDAGVPPPARERTRRPVTAIFQYE